MCVFSLNKLGLSNYWINQQIHVTSSFKQVVKNRIKDQFVQNWNGTIGVSSKCLNYRLYKHEFVFEKYFQVLPNDLAISLCKFRLMNHKLPIEKGRFEGIARELRTCHLCNDNLLGDEFHYLFKCKHFDEDRVKYIEEYFYNIPTTMKFSCLMNNENKDT